MKKIVRKEYLTKITKPPIEH